MVKILIVDDEQDMLILLKRMILEERQFDIFTESDPVSALELLKKKQFDILITDLRMPKLSGLELLTEALKLHPNLSVIVMTAYSTVQTAVDTIKKGAYDYISKPFKRERILLTIDKAIQFKKILNENQKLQEEKKPPFIIGNSDLMQKIYKLVEQVAPTSATVLITGESGTGKEMIAETIHLLSKRANQKFTTINCSAIPEQLLESELFGHIKGSFTGAIKDKKGIVEEADQGTLFLDEIADLPLTLQTKILRLLQEGEFRPVGCEINKKANLRFIAATNKDLKTAIADKTFREDLYYRLNVIQIKLPSLKERREDIPVLADYFLKKYNAEYKKDIKEIEKEAINAILGYEFSGNIRELKNIIERAVILSKSNSLTLIDIFPEEFKQYDFSKVDKNVFNLSFKEAKNKVVESFHKEYIVSLLKKHKGNVSRAANEAGLKRQYLHKLIKEANLEPSEYKLKNEK